MSERVGPVGTSRPAPLVSPIEPPPSRWAMPTSGPIDESDIVALGADLEPGTLLAAYRQGLFPMPYDRRRIAWFSPARRGIIPLDGLRVSRSLRRSVEPVRRPDRHPLPRGDGGLRRADPQGRVDQS